MLKRKQWAEENGWRVLRPSSDFGPGTVYHGLGCENRTAKECLPDCTKACFVRTEENGDFVCELAKGCVVAEKTHHWLGGGGDDDYFAVYWDQKENAFPSIMYATTRGWSYANSAYIDAPDCVKDLYRAWLDGLGKMETRKRAWLLKEELKDLAKKWRLQLSEIEELVEIYKMGTAEWNAIAGLLKIKNFRSSFRASLNEQLRTWLKTDPGERKYQHPLSFRQMESLTQSVGYARSWH